MPVPAGDPVPADEVTVLVCSSCRRDGDPLAEPRPGGLLAADARRAAAGTRRRGAPRRLPRQLPARPDRGDLPHRLLGLRVRRARDGSGADLVAGARLFAESTDGFMPFRRGPEALKRGLVARIPHPDILKDLP